MLAPVRPTDDRTVSAGPDALIKMTETETESPDSRDDEEDEEAQMGPPDCPICLDPKDDMYVMICGHKICNDCRPVLIAHGQFVACPICRFPFTAVGIAARHEVGQIPADIYQGMIQHIIHEQVVEEQIIQEPVYRAIRRNRHERDERRYECIGNVVCSFLAMIFIFSFFLLSSN